MQNARFLLLVAGVTAAILALLLWQSTPRPPGPAVEPAPAKAAAPTPAAAVLPPVVAPATPPPPAAAPARVTAAQNPVITPPPPLPPGITAIQDQKTIDFSSGKAQVKNETDDKAALEAGLREIEEATKGVTFGPGGGPPTLPGPP
jgi:hypothetical protein